MQLTQIRLMLNNFVHAMMLLEKKVD